MSGRAQFLGMIARHAHCPTPAPKSLRLRVRPDSCLTRSCRKTSTITASASTCCGGRVYEWPFARRIFRCDASSPVIRGRHHAPDASLPLLPLHRDIACRSRVARVLACVALDGFQSSALTFTLSKEYDLGQSTNNPHPCGSFIARARCSRRSNCRRRHTSNLAILRRWVQSRPTWLCGGRVRRRPPGAGWVGGWVWRRLGRRGAA